jgi:predicted ABC-type ATPase
MAIQIRIKKAKPNRFVWSDEEAEQLFAPTARKFNPNHRPGGDEHGGEFTTDDGAGETTVDNPPKAKKPFLVYRLGSSKSATLENRNAGNSFGVGEYAMMMPDAEERTIHVFEVQTDKKLQPYTPYNGGEADAAIGKTTGIGHRRLMSADGSEATDLFSFGTDGYSAKHLGSFPVKTLIAKLRELHPDDGKIEFWEYGKAKIAGAIRATSKSVLAQKFNPNHRGPGDDRGGEFTTAETAGIITVHDRLGNAVDIDENSSLARWTIKNKDGTYSVDPERELLHQQIVNEFLEGVERQNGQVEMYMTGGGPAAGKSSVLVDGMLPELNEAIQINPDLIKEKLPEYVTLKKAGDIGAAGYVHEESSLIRKRLEAAAISGNYNVVLDTTGDSSVDKLTSSMEAYRKAGYKINAFYATNDVDLAVKLADARGKKTGRYVPPQFIQEVHANVSRTFPKAVERGLFDRVELYDTNIKDAPRLVGSGDRNGFTVKDQKLWDAFLAKGNSGYATAKAADKDNPVDTDRVERILVAILNGTTKSKLALNTAEKKLWAALAKELKSVPEGMVVDVGNELSPVDLTNLYSDTKKQKTAGQVEATQWVTIKRIDGDKQIVYGEVYAPWVLDTYGEFMTTEDIELMAHRFMRLDLSKVIDTQHDNQPNGSYPVESFIARDGDPHYTPGAWVLGVHVPDPSLWHAVKNGQLNGFSFQSLVKPTDVDVEISAIRDFVGETELCEDHSHTFFVELNDIGNVVGGRTSKAADGHCHEIKGASVTGRTGGHSHRFFL